MNRGGEEERGDKAPRPLRGRQSAAAERRGAGGLGCARGTSAARPPEIKREEYRLSEGREGHAKVQEQQRPHVGSGESNKKAGDDGPQQNGQLRPRIERAVLRRHGKCLGTVRG